MRARWPAGALLLLTSCLTSCSGAAPPTSPEELPVELPGELPSSSPANTSASPRVVPPPAGAVADYQLGGAYEPADDVRVVVRDRTAEPAAGLYSVCYVNAVPDPAAGDGEWLREPGPAAARGRRRRAGPGLARGVPPRHDDPDKRAALAEVVGAWIDGCADAGFQAVEADNLDSATRSDGVLTMADAYAYSALLSARAHARGLAYAQKNAAGTTAEQARAAGFDFAVAESCQVYAECGDYTDVHGDRVLEVEYADDGREPFEEACAARGGRGVGGLPRPRAAARGVPGLRVRPLLTRTREHDRGPRRGGALPQDELAGHGPVRRLGQHPEVVQELAHGPATDLAQVVAHRAEPGHGDVGVLDVVETHDADVVGHPDPGVGARAHEAERDLVVGRDDGRDVRVGAQQGGARGEPGGGAPVGGERFDDVEAALGEERAPQLPAPPGGGAVGGPARWRSCRCPRSVRWVMAASSPGAGSLSAAGSSADPSPSMTTTGSPGTRGRGIACMSSVSTPRTTASTPEPTSEATASDTAATVGARSGHSARE